MTTVKKQFIAGVVCPSCGAQDTIQMYTIDEEQFRECVDCGFSDEMEKEPSLLGKPLATRVSPEEELKQEQARSDDVQIVHILDNSKLH
ncbi:hypothetical protein EOPP23_10160 [Endozoicomonas sp. OPT23]|uniref:YheV family putative zinc ribbon protein n=1 Tax=Endozoicomonas sp. OPT23 TaxID=2072845 RepID=UPI00129B190C|nr:YheV family putative zinc ribbon protein [Endozoicomonas sp. OPT23]MRI33347.1 hypothetical protein [Endozoicomonas sp. OPT23]